LESPRGLAHLACVDLAYRRVDLFLNEIPKLRTTAQSARQFDEKIA